MNLTPEQMMAAHKANVEAIVGMTRQAFSGMEQLMELNLSLTKTVLAEAHQLSLDTLKVKDTQELLALQTGLLAPMTQKILSYQHELTQMAQALGGDIGAQSQSQLAQGQVQIKHWMPKESSLNLSSEPMFNAFKVAVEVGSEAMGNVQKALQGATAMLDEQFKTQMPHSSHSTGARPASRTSKPAAKTAKKSRH